MSFGAIDPEGSGLEMKAGIEVSDPRSKAGRIQFTDSRELFAQSLSKTSPLLQGTDDH